VAAAEERDRCTFLPGFCELLSTVHQKTLLQDGKLNWADSQRSEYVWTEEHKKAFQEVKKAETTAPVLLTPDPAGAFELTTDASGYAIGAVLQQMHEGKLRPVAFGSRKLNPAEQRYATHDRETLAIIYALLLWRCYLLGRKVLVWTDHMSLKYLMTQPNLSSRQVRWVAFLADYDLEIRYKPGKENVVADALSRRPDYQIHIGGVSFANMDNSVIKNIQQSYSSDLLVAEQPQDARFRMVDSL